MKEGAEVNILFAASESSPFAKTGGLGDVSFALPKNLSLNPDINVSVVLPLYGSIGEEWRSKMNFIKHIYIKLAWRDVYCGIFSLDLNGVTYFFIDNEYYFKRDNLYGYYDDGERFAFFCEAVCDIIPHIGFTPDIIHCNDWQTSLIPVYIRLTPKSGFEKIKLLFTIHNIEYQGKFGEEILPDVCGLDVNLGRPGGILEFMGGVNLMKSAIEISDIVTTVSPTYAEELGHEFFVHGLQSVIERNRHKIRGILNGIDTDYYNPETGYSIVKNFSAKSLGGKFENKASMQKMLGLAVNPDIPVVSMITRLVSHKGVDLVLSRFSEMMNLDIQFVLLGRGDLRYENAFSSLMGAHTGRFSANITYSEDLAMRIYAGSDFFLMPSQIEPCGLSQMMAMRYGAIPVVRETGGLKDTVKPYSPAEGTGTGFTFASFNADDMLDALRRAREAYKNKPAWEQIMRRAMKSDFSWDKSAGEYISLYKSLA